MNRSEWTFQLFAVLDVLVGRELVTLDGYAALKLKHLSRVDQLAAEKKGATDVPAQPQA